jgi:hypothetical protein
MYCTSIHSVLKVVKNKNLTTYPLTQMEKNYMGFLSRSNFSYVSEVLGDGLEMS